MSIFDSLNNTQQIPQSNPLQGTPFGNMMTFMNQLNQFRQGFSGNAQQMTQQLLQSGKISQDVYNQKYQLAQQIYGMLTGRF